MNKNRLELILSWVRPHGTEMEEAFVSWLVDEIKRLGYQPTIDGVGNIWVEQEGAKTLFTAHTDTCHSQSLSVFTQDVDFDWDITGMALLANPTQGYVLGADDGTGVWLLLEMMEAKVPGSYVFFRGEERGGIGSQWAAEHLELELKQYSHAVAFDRAGDVDVITYQRCQRCCSDAFATALAERLNLLGDTKFAPCDGGVFTDTANLDHIIPECTNVAVGYQSQHTSSEVQDLFFLQILRDQVVQLDWASLPVERDPSVVDSLRLSYDYGYDYGYGFGRYASTAGDYDYDYKLKLTPTLTSTSTSTDDGSVDLDAEADNISRFGYDYAADLVYGDPELAIALLLFAYN